MKIVINTAPGWFQLSEKAMALLGSDESSISYDDYDQRANLRLVAVVEKLGKEAAGPISRLEVVEIPYGIDWAIIDMDGEELVVDRNRVWGGSRFKMDAPRHGGRQW